MTCTSAGVRALVSTLIVRAVGWNASNSEKDKAGYVATERAAMVTARHCGGGIETAPRT
jgi:hypothetical protein